MSTDRDFLRRQVIVVGVAASVLAAAVVLYLGRDEGPAAGVFRHTSLDNVREFERWSGQSLSHVIDFSSREDWRDIAAPDYMLEEWQGSGLRPVYALAMVPDQVPATMEQGAAGEYDKHFRELAERLVEHDQADAILRVGWEFNLRASRYNTDPETFRSYFRRIVTVMREVPGQQLEFDWNVNNGPSGDDATPFYPGDDVVDYVGVDTYDVSPQAYPYPEPCDDGCRQERQDQAWEQILNGELGLSYWRDFARDRGKPLSVPEWGVWERQDGIGGGDNPTFIRRMHEFLHDEDHQVAYHAYFESNNNGVGPHRLMASFPEAGRVYRSLFGD